MQIYVLYQFELGLPENIPVEKICVVGDFNNWVVGDQWRLQYDHSIKKYKIIGSLRRGVYDYQYVQDDNDWIVLEGNDWRTVNVYTHCSIIMIRSKIWWCSSRILLAAQKRKFRWNRSNGTIKRNKNESHYRLVSFGVGHLGSLHAKMYAQIPAVQFVGVYDTDIQRSTKIAA